MIYTVYVIVNFYLTLALLVFGNCTEATVASIQAIFSSFNLIFILVFAENYFLISICLAVSVTLETISIFCFSRNKSENWPIIACSFLLILAVSRISPLLGGNSGVFGQRNVQFFLRISPTALIIFIWLRRKLLRSAGFHQD